MYLRHKYTYGSTPLRCILSHNWSPQIIQALADEDSNSMLIETYQKF